MATRHERHLIQAGSMLAHLSGPAARIPAGEGLTLVTSGKGKKASWFFRYSSPVTGKPANITHRVRCWIGTDGKVAGCGLDEGYAWHDAQMKLLGEGKDPAIERDKADVDAQLQEAKRQTKLVEDAAEAKWQAAVAEWRTNMKRKPPAGTLARAVEDYCDSLVGIRAPDYIKNIRYCLGKHAFPHFGHKRCDDVTEKDIAAMDAASVAKAPKALEHARVFLIEVFKWAKDPAQGLRTKPCPVFPMGKQTAARIPKSTPRLALVEPTEIAQLMRSINGPVAQNRAFGGEYRSRISARAVLQLLSYTGQRIDSALTARREHFNLDTGVWTIPAIHMKGKHLDKIDPKAKPHIVYLSTQAVKALRELEAQFPEGDWMFPGFTAGKPVSYEAVNEMLDRLGYEDKHDLHGFRGMLRSAGEDYVGIDSVVLEAMGLGHKAAKEGSKEIEARKLALEMVREILSGEVKVSDEIALGGHGNTYYRETAKRVLSWEEKCRAAMQRWGDWLEQIQRPQLQLLKAA